MMCLKCSHRNFLLTGLKSGRVRTLKLLLSRMVKFFTNVRRKKNLDFKLVLKEKENS